MPTRRHCITSDAHNRWARFHCIGAKTGDVGIWSWLAGGSNRSRPTKVVWREGGSGMFSRDICGFSACDYRDLVQGRRQAFESSLFSFRSKLGRKKSPFSRLFCSVASPYLSINQSSLR